MTQPWFKFYGAVWRGDVGLRSCSIAARGFWLEMMIVMDQAAPRGSLLLNGKPVDLNKLAGMAGIDRKEAEKLFKELDSAGVFSRDPDGTIFSRKMRRDQAQLERDKANGKGGGNPSLKGVVKLEVIRRVNGGVNPLDKG